MRYISSLLQFILGFLLGIALLAGAGAATGYYILTQFSTNPDEPDFSEPEAEAAIAESETTVAAQETVAAAPQPEPQPEPTFEERFGADAFKARVTWNAGLSLRSEPSLQASRVGGVGYNQEIYILSTSSDGRWQKIHVPATGQEAWVKAGNVQRIN